MTRLTALKEVVASPHYSALLQMGVLSNLAERNLRLAETYTALRAAGVAPLRSARQTAKIFRCSQRRVYQILSEVEVLP